MEKIMSVNGNRFCALWQRNAIKRNSAANETFQLIKAQYGQPQRHFHNSSHIRQCLKQMDEAKAVLGQSDAVELALWFHDVVYTPGRADNERLSAEWFSLHAAMILPSDLVDQVSRLIICTEHRTLPVSQDEQFVVDVDLSGFGMSAQKFHHNGLNIRKEMSTLNDQAYVLGARKFLEKLRCRERIFSTDFFNAKYEKNALRNIEAQLALYDRGLM